MHDASTRWRLLPGLILIALAIIAPLSGCGGDDQEAPTAVVEADLDKNGEFWDSLTPDLKDDLIQMGKDRLAEERGNVVLGTDTDDLVTEVEEEYTNESKRETTIYDTYVQANNDLARQELDSALDQMETYRSDP